MALAYGAATTLMSAVTFLVVFTVMKDAGAGAGGTVAAVVA